MAALDRIIGARDAAAAVNGGNADAETASMRESLAYWIDMVDEVIGRPVVFGGFQMGALGDSEASIADMIKPAPGGGA